MQRCLNFTWPGGRSRVHRLEKNGMGTPSIWLQESSHSCWVRLSRCRLSGEEHPHSCKQSLNYPLWKSPINSQVPWSELGQNLASICPWDLVRAAEILAHWAKHLELYGLQVQSQVLWRCIIYIVSQDFLSPKQFHSQYPGIEKKSKYWFPEVLMRLSFYLVYNENENDSLFLQKSWEMPEVWALESELKPLDSMVKLGPDHTTSYRTATKLELWPSVLIKTSFTLCG